MTEGQWLACDDPQRMLSFLNDEGGGLTGRKLRLFACAASRLVGSTSDKRLREAIDIAERYADGNATSKDLQYARHLSEPIIMSRGDPAALESVLTLATANSASRAWHAVPFVPDGDKGKRLAQAALLRCVVGNPFQYHTLEQSWLTSTVANLAQAIYDDRGFDRLPILADALEDAGCTNQDILNHCRGGGEHARGCWVVDLLLERE
jgi:hypothetical protein